MPLRPLLLLLLWYWPSLLETVVGASLRGLNNSRGSLKKTLGNSRLVDRSGGGLEATMNTDQCGLDVAIDGTIAIVGCPGANFGVGKVQVFNFENGDWKLSTTIQPTTVSMLGLFGTNVAIRNSVIVVGAFTNSPHGGAYVYEKVSGVWTETASLSLENPAVGDQFGRDVAISEDGRTIVIGASLADVKDVDEAGIVAVYRKEGNVWARKGTLLPQHPETLSGFGSSLGIHGRTIVVGAFQRNVGNSKGQGEVFVFEEFPESNFTQTALLRADDGASSDSFGNAVDIHQDRIVVGALNDDIGATADAGSAYVFDRVEERQWKQIAKLTPSETSPQNRFGQSVAVFGEQVAVGSVGADVFQPDAGSVYVFERVNQKEFIEKVILGSNQNQLVGISVGFSSTALIVGASGGVRGSAFVESTTTLGQCVPQVTSFSALNVNNGQESEIDFEVNVEKLGGLINIRAEVDDCGQPESYMCAKLELGSDSRLQRSKPLSLFASTGGTPDTGFGLLKACLYEDSNCEVGRKGCLEIDIVVLDCTPKIKSFTLYDALTDQPIEAISNRGSLCLPSGGMINIQAIAECVENVEFAFRGADGRSDDRVESTAPYFLYGDSGVDVLPQYDMKPMPPGLYALRARFQPASSLLGQGTVLTQRFSLIDCSTAQPSLLPSAVPSSSPSNATATISPSSSPSSRATAKPLNLATVKLQSSTPVASPASTVPATLPPTTHPSVAPSSKVSQSATSVTSSPTTEPNTTAPTAAATSRSWATTSPSAERAKTAKTTLSPSLSQRTNTPTVTSPTMLPTKQPITISPTTLAPATTAPSTEPTRSPQTGSPSLLQRTNTPTMTSPTSSPSIATSSPTAFPTTLAPATTAPSTEPTRSPQTGSPSLLQRTNTPTVTSPTSSPSIVTSSPTAFPTTLAPATTAPSTEPTRSPQTGSPSLLQRTNTPTVTSPTSSPSIVTSSPTAFPTTLAPATLAPSTEPSKKLRPALTLPPASGAPVTLSPVTAASASSLPSLNVPPTLSPVVVPPSIGGITSVPVTLLPTATPNASSTTSVPTQPPTPETSTQGQNSQTLFPTIVSTTSSPTTSPTTPAPTVPAKATLAPMSSQVTGAPTPVSPSPTLSPMVRPPSIGGGTFFFAPGNDD